MISIEKLEAVAAESISPAQPPPTNNASNGAANGTGSSTRKPGGFNLEAFISTNLKVRTGPIAWGDGQRWILEHCPFNPEEHLDGCAVVTRTAAGVLGYKCHHNSCSGHHWQDLREKFDPRAQRQQQEQRQGTAAQEAGGPRIRSISEVPTIESFSFGPIDYIEQPVLARGTVNGLTGDAGGGKSSLVCAWARRAHKAGYPVLVLDRENPLSIVQERFRRLKITTDEKFVVWGGWLPEEAPQPASAMVLSWVASCGPKPLVIVDSLSAFFDGDQNSADEMRRFMQQLRRLADLGATVVVVHHDGKSDTARDFRGSSDFKACVDAAYHVTNIPDGPDSRLLHKLIVRPFKSRFGLGGSLVYRYADGTVELEQRENAATATITEQLTSLLRTHPGTGKTDFEKLAEQGGLGRNRARDFLDAGVLAGSIRREGKPGKGYRHFLEVDEDPLKEADGDPNEADGERVGS
jgi:KaiC/GvpD/RAD55 family RecA-like ATPase